MSSRLDRLFLLLEQGTSSVTRKAAAQQLGEVQKLHPHELNNLLIKVRQYLQSSSWDTRIAASQAVEAIISNVSQWSPHGDKSSDSDFTCQSKSGRMLFSNYDVNKVIKHGRNLLGSDGTEYDTKSTEVLLEDVTSKEKLETQRRLLNQRLGLDVAEKLNLGISSEDMISNDDLAEMTKPDPDQKIKSEVSLQDKLDEVTNVGKRKPGNSNGSSQSKKPKTEITDLAAEDKIIDFNNLDRWPLECFSDELMYDLFSPSWEIRHGAATALREIVRLHGRGAGRVIDAPHDQMDELNQQWLEDLTLRFISVMALDKFGDFVSDQVVAPVRETCAQALGSIFNVMTIKNIKATLDILIDLLERPEWEARHGGLLGIKYLLAIRQDIANQLLPTVFNPVFKRLKDPVDDVSAVAAAALVPVKNSLIETLPESVTPTVSFLWDALLDIDELTSSTSNILMLLSSLLSHSEENLQNLHALVPRLWPFLEHTLTTVRKSVLEAFLTLVKSAKVTPIPWLEGELVQTALSLLYQRGLVESNQTLLKLIYECWEAVLTNCEVGTLYQITAQLISGWICLMMHPSKLPIDTKTSPVWYNVPHSESDEHRHEESDKCYLGGSESLSDNAIIRERNIFRARIHASKCIGLLAYFITQPIEEQDPTPLECFSNILLFHLNSKSSIQRTCISLIVKEWANVYMRYKCESPPRSFIPTNIMEKTMECLQEFVYYDEISSAFAKLQHETRDFVATLKGLKFPLDETVYKVGTVYTFDQISELSSTVVPNLYSSLKLKSKQQESLDERRRSLLRSVQEVVKSQSSLSTTTLAALSSAVVSWAYVPEKLNPLIRPLMDAIKREENEQLQKESAVHLVFLLALCHEKFNGQPNSPIPKVIKNLISFLCCDPNHTPPVISLPTPFSFVQTTLKRSGSSSSAVSTPTTPVTPVTPSTPSLPDTYNGIITLNKMQRISEKMYAVRRNNSILSKRGSAADINAPTNEAQPGVSTDSVSVTSVTQESNNENELMRRGASSAVIAIANHFGVSIKTKLPHLWDILTTRIKANSEKTNEESAQDLVQSLQVLEVIGAHVPEQLHESLVSLLEPLRLCLENCYSAVRHMAARCFGVFSSVILKETLNCLLDDVLVMLDAADSEVRRQGAVEAISCVIDSLGFKVVPYVVLFIVPMLGRMSDQNEYVRLLATHCFAQLVQLMPLDPGDNGIPLKSGLLERKKDERRFLEQLLNVKKLENFKIPVPVKAELRSYQQDGVNWLAFLNRYKLHGILCDEMGLGKTLMSICILAADHHQRAHRYQETKSVDSKPLPSMVVCPPTLTGHWAYEIDKFVDKSLLNILHYTGPPAERYRLREKLSKRSKNQYNLLVVSYDIVRNDIDFFGAIKWNYVILDEGHIIKNGKTKLSKAVKSLSANHRLILTGTPIQNNVLELWSLFDFLMPGFLGSERQFVARFSRPILASRDAKSSSKEQEAGVLAMESLHRQVLPFILRRMKEDVLKDLPPKIMQDYYCELSPLQARLYEDFAKSRVRQNLEENIDYAACGTGNTDDKPRTNHVASHIFQALQYLRKVCNHPKLVVSAQHPEYESICAQLANQNSSLSDINHAAKLVALKQLLLDCGIGVQSQNGLAGQPVVNQHRALIFCQLKSVLDIVENDLLKAHMPTVSYMRLDGSVPPGSRHSVVHRFNNDPSIDVLLLTTQVSEPHHTFFNNWMTTGWWIGLESDRSRYSYIR